MRREIVTNRKRGPRFKKTREELRTLHERCLGHNGCTGRRHRDTRRGRRMAWNQLGKNGHDAELFDFSRCGHVIDVFETHSRENVLMLRRVLSHLPYTRPATSLEHIEQDRS